MSALLFRDAQPARTTAPHRADVACFIGFVARRAATPLPGRLKSWLQEHGWRARGEPVADDDALLHVPVPLDSFEAFDRLFAWETRPPQPHAFPFTSWLGAAVRSFFRQGGARCFVVRVGDPAPYPLRPDRADPAGIAADLAARRERLGRLLPGLAGGGVPPAEPAARSTWRGLGVLLGLEESAFVCLPDLPECVADAALPPAGLAPLPPAPESFVPCTPTVAPPRDEVRQVSAAPACTANGFLAWRHAARHAAQFVRTHRRDVQLVLAVPLADPALATVWTRGLADDAHVLGLGRSLDATDGIATAFLQLCHPWIHTPGSEALPGGLEPPDGVFAGVLARTLPRLGAGHSIGRQPLRGVHGFEPRLTVDALVLDTPAGATPALIHRVSLLGPGPDGPRVLSDVTTSLAAAHRPAGIGRLTAAILRAARGLGDTLAFEPSGPELARRIRTQLEQRLADFHAAGALQGVTAADAYSVRCDETTTTPHDLDHGRVIAEVRFNPAQPVGQIVVILSLREGAVSAVDVLT